MKKTIEKISVIGDGGWGTTLAIFLLKKGYLVKLWGPFSDYISHMRENRYNSKFLPDIKLPSALQLTSDLTYAVAEADLIVFAIPSRYARNIIKRLARVKTDFTKKFFVSVTKGIDNVSLERISEMLVEWLGTVDVAVLSGPTIAIEVARNMPSTAVVAARRATVAKIIQNVFNSQFFRVYTNTDVIGVELCGSIKNIIAIACGVCDGLGFGANTKAAILTRGLVEMARLGSVMGAKRKTFSGLAGLGDMVTTCFSPKSRNRYVGEQLGKGKFIDDILSSMEMVAEGVDTVKSVYKLSLKYEVYMPITHEVYHIIYKNKPPIDAVSSLMNRKLKSE